MSKLKYFILLLPFLFISYVNADTLPSYTLNNAYTSSFSFDNQLSVCSTYSDVIDNLKSYYNNNLSASYPYYTIQCYQDTAGHVYINLNFTRNNTVKGFSYDSSFRYIFHYDGAYSYMNYPDVSYTLSYTNEPYDVYTDLNSFEFGGFPIYESNVDFAYSSSDDGSHFGSDYIYYQELVYPSYSYNNTPINGFHITDNNPLPTIKSIIDYSYEPSDIIGYTEINLNNYSYVALSLKNYNTDSFNTVFYVKGQLCLTPVYDYGMKNKADYYSGYQVQGCSPIYDTFTPVKVSILESDLTNHSIYYVKSYNTSIDNIIKVNNSIFDITYITSENASNPYVSVGGITYPTIPYNQLDSSATASESDGYISGQVCPIGDVNCYYEATGIDISVLFSNPLKVLESVWSSITTMFTMIFAFYSLLPPVLRTFMTSAFMLAVILGIIKIIIS